jgi:hypothetical protein
VALPCQLLRVNRYVPFDLVNRYVLGDVAKMPAFFWEHEMPARWGY